MGEVKVAVAKKLGSLALYEKNTAEPEARQDWADGYDSEEGARRKAAREVADGVVGTICEYIIERIEEALKGGSGR